MFPRCLLFLGCCLCSAAWASVVRETLHLTWKEGSPNGQPRKLIHTNGQFPGPSLVFDEDDDVEITVINDMPRNTTVHWHGLAQPGTPWADGVIGLTQRPILPGDKYVYKFKATPPGNHWYHSHERMSLTDGLYGALLIKPKESQTDLWSHISDDAEDIKAMTRAAADPKFLVVSDWSQFTSEEYWTITQEAGLQFFCVDSILINGVGSVYCPSPEFLDNQTQPGIKRSAFLPGDHVSDKGCLPFREAVEGGPWNYTARPEKIPPHLQEGCVPSTGTNATIEVDPEAKWVSLNFIAAATVVQFVFSIDGHEFWIYEIDGNTVKPQKYVSASMSAGETFSVMVKLDQAPGVYTIRVPGSGATQVISGFANLVYKGSDEVKTAERFISYGGLSTSGYSTNHSYTPWQLETDHMSIWPPNPPRQAPADEEFLLVIGKLGSAINYTMNAKQIFPINLQADNPLLYNPNALVGTDKEDLVLRTKNGSWVDLILQVSTMPGEPAAFSHFMHKHGSKMWRIGFGHGLWNYSSVSEAMQLRPKDFNLIDPGYRDTWITAFSPVPAGGYWSVFRYLVDNPGPWLFHCHIELHEMGGMAIAILDGVDAWPEVPPEYLRSDFCQ